MMKQSLLFLVIFFAALNLQAQVLTLLNATQQSWSGGVCCRVGTNYVITLESSETVHPIVINTVWIGNKWYAPGDMRITTSKSNGKTNYLLNIADSWDTKNNMNMMTKEPQKAKIPPPAYKGRACIVYSVNRHKKLLPVENFKGLPRIAYP